MSKNVAVFVDVANIFYAAKAAGVDIDYVTLLRAATAGRDFVRAYAYTGLDPENENQRNFHAFLQRHGYRVVSKDIRKYGDGKVKANLDIELVVDMLKTARNLDIAVLVSGDGDFAPAIRAVQEMGVRVEVISFRGNTSSDLIEVADQFIDITQIAKVEKGSTRSGRRVAATAEEDLSMTAVPEKESEGTGRGRGRGRARSRAAGEGSAAASGAAASGAAASGAVAAAASTSTPGPAEAGAPALEAAARGTRARRGRTSGAPVLTLLPGEKLSGRAAAMAGGPQSGAAPGEGAEEAEVEEAEEGAETIGEGLPGAGAAVASGGGEGTSRRRRRRRRGGRGRGRARTEGLEGAELEGIGPEEEAEAASLAPLPPPSPSRHGTFGSVWDSQIGMPSAPRTDVPLVDEDLEEPEVPEYLLAERRRRAQGGRGRGARVARGYAAAVERERFGRSGVSGGLTRYPDVGPRATVPGPGGRLGRGERPVEGRERPREEPWSEVPPEIEAMLRAQLAARRRGESGAESSAAESAEEARGGGGVSEGAAETVAPARESPSPAFVAPAPEAPSEAIAPKRRTTRRRSPARASAEAESPVPSAEAAAERSPEVAAPPALSAEGAEGAPASRRTPRGRRTSRATATAAEPTSTEAARAGADLPGAEAAEGDAPAEAATRRRTVRRRGAAATATESAGAEPASESATAGTSTRRRATRRRKAEAETSQEAASEASMDVAGTD